jgi:hypothetical protein
VHEVLVRAVCVRLDVDQSATYRRALGVGVFAAATPMSIGTALKHFVLALVLFAGTQTGLRLGYIDVSR